MHPILFRIGPLTIHTYGLLVAVGFLIGLGFAVRQARKEGIPADKIIDPFLLISPIEGSKKRRYYAVLHIPPIDSPEKAIRASIMHDHKSSKKK